MSDGLTSETDDENQKTINAADLQKMLKNERNKSNSGSQVKSTSMTSFSFLRQTSRQTNSDSSDSDNIIDDFDTTYNTEEMPILEAQDKHRHAEIFAGKRRQAARRYSTTVHNIPETPEKKLDKKTEFHASNESLSTSVISHNQMEAVHREAYEKRHKLPAKVSKVTGGREKMDC